MNGNESKRIYYLLLKGYVWCPDGDEHLGIYTDIDKLKQAYLAENLKLEELKVAGKDRNYTLSIYKFNEECYGTNEGVVLIDPKSLWE